MGRRWRAVSYERREVLEDDGDDEVEEDEGAKHLEGEEEGDGEVGAAALARAAARTFFQHGVGHHPRPRIAGEHLEEEQRRGGEGLEVAVLVDLLAHRGEEAEQRAAEHRVDEDDEREERGDVDEGRKGEDHRHDQVAQLLCALEQPENAKQSHDAQHSQQIGRQRHVLI